MLAVRNGVYSLNVPVPGQVATLASDISRDLPAARARCRGEHTLCVKRLDRVDSETAYSRLEARAREALAGQPAFEVRVTGVAYFEEAVRGSTPVVYLAIESPELRRLHERLSTVFEPVETIEGEEYTPHVTVARGGSMAAARRAADRQVDPITWRVSELSFWDATRRQAVSTVSLPA
jgi:2'-5' RNA ligase